MKIITNPDKYLSKRLVNSFFEIGTINHVDKVMTGNGATTAFLTTPPEINKTKILIAPNKGVVINKREQYNDNANYSFVYKESDHIIYGSSFVVIVVDTFFLKLDLITQMVERGDVEAILVDEYHSMQQQSAFRPKLEMFIDKLEELKDLCKIATITATPTDFQEVTIRIDNINQCYAKTTVIEQHNDHKELIKTAKKLADANKKILLATNSAATICQFADKNKILKAHLIIGESLMGNITEKVIIKPDIESNIVVISSRGFEGVDILGPDYTIFFFENRRSPSTTFYISNLIQAINRTRDGAQRIYYGRVNNIKARPTLIDPGKVINLKETTEISFEKKQNKDHQAANKYLIFDQDNEIITANDWLYGLEMETIKYDEGLREFREYLNDRKIKIIDMNKETPNPIGAPRIRNAEYFLMENQQLIEEQGLFGDDYRLQAYYYEDLKTPQRDLVKYMRRKNYNGQFVPNERLMRLKEIISDPEVFRNIVEKATKLQKRYYFQVKFKNKPDVAATEFDNFVKNVNKNILHFMFSLANDTIRFKKEIVGSRDFNVLVRLGEAVLKYISEDVFNLQMDIFDIKNAYPRILYALAGEQLKDDFYGSDKKNKVKINVMLNDKWHKNDSNMKPAHLKATAIRDFKKLNFLPNVIEYYMENFYTRKHKDGVYNTFAKHEKKIINSALQILINDADENEKPFLGYGRRHDSLVFFNYTGHQKILTSLEYLGQNGWFK